MRFFCLTLIWATGVKSETECSNAAKQILNASAGFVESAHPYASNENCYYKVIEKTGI